MRPTTDKKKARLELSLNELHGHHHPSAYCDISTIGPRINPCVGPMCDEGPADYYIRKSAACVPNFAVPSLPHIPSISIRTYFPPSLVFCYSPFSNKTHFLISFPPKTQIAVIFSALITPISLRSYHRSRKTSKTSRFRSLEKESGEKTVTKRESGGFWICIFFFTVLISISIPIFDLSS